MSTVDAGVTLAPWFSADPPWINPDRLEFSTAVPPPTPEASAGAIRADVPAAPDLMGDQWNLRPSAEVLASTVGRQTFLVEGLIHEATTLVWGASKSGKSSLLVGVVVAAASGRPWHGHAVIGGPMAVAVLTSDPGGLHEWAERLGWDAPANVLLSVPPPVNDLEWKAMAEHLAYRRVRLLVLDNYYSWARGLDVNKNAEVGSALACLDHVLRKDIAVVLVHHSDASGRKAAGVHSLIANSRSVLHVAMDRMTVSSNEAPLTHYSLTRDGWRVTNASIMDAEARLSRKPKASPRQTPVDREAAWAAELDAAERVLLDLPSLPGSTRGKGKALVVAGLTASEFRSRRLAKALEDAGRLARPAPVNAGPDPVIASNSEPWLEGG